MKEPKSNIVFDGRRLREGEDYTAVKRRLLLEVQRQHEDELRRASFWQRLWLRVKMRREVHAELKKQFPPAALHFVRST
ncbi:MAG: hypothetical protein QM790_05895 [Nibricoccus sp.]